MLYEDIEVKLLYNKASMSFGLKFSLSHFTLSSSIYLRSDPRSSYGNCNVMMSSSK